MKIIKNLTGDTLELDDMSDKALKEILHTCKELSIGSSEMSELAREALKVIRKQFPEYFI